MSRFVLSLAAGFIAALSIAAPTMAGNPGSGPSHGSSMHHTGVSKDHFHYSSRYWNSKYGCYFYSCPGTSYDYYWCETHTCYYPVTYIEYLPPKVITVEPPPVVKVLPPKVITVESKPIVHVLPPKVINVEPKPIVNVLPPKVIDVESKPIVNVLPPKVVTIEPKPIVTVLPPKVITVQPTAVVQVPLP